MIIDAHNHIGGPDIGDGRAQTVDELIAKMDVAEIDRAVIFPFNNPDRRGSFAAANLFIAKAVADFPDRLIGFARVDPRYADAVAELETALTVLGLRGLKLHPRAQNFYLDDPALFKVMDKLVELGRLAIFDSGTSHAPWPEVARLAGRYPDLPLIMAHMYSKGFMEAATACPNIYLGITDIRNTARIESAIRELGAERIISGSDSPYIAPRIEQDKINSLNIGEAEKDLIKGGNIERLLGGVKS